ncbi:hypothetical protein TNIN_261611 [Trichonephila inaurata madagascariensis]|uniref:Uncharacterized protein n=1 Tax=Trichonephila inaurata madagascariensis TaxID=2747483 RepID=A0A8X6X9X6_9ARAC|nr:hypothetical protein TNIN_261611 [Trichonephila inaurata madagascariensis]
MRLFVFITNVIVRTPVTVSHLATSYIANLMAGPSNDTQLITSQDADDLALMTDAASDFGLGASANEITSDGLPKPLGGFFSKKLAPAQTKYSAF